MAKGPRYRVGYRRKRQQKTNYKSRIKILKSGLTRLVVRPSSKHMLVQMVTYKEDGDRIEVTVTSKELKKYGWTHSTGNIPAAYLTGLICGLKGKKKKIVEAILDLGMNTSVKGSRIYATLKGALDSGMNIKHDEKMLPTEDRLTGVHVASHMQKSKDITSDFNKTKEKIENDLKK